MADNKKRYDALFISFVSSDDTYEVLAGTNTLSEGGTRHTVTFISSHEGYDASDSWINDIAVLKVSPAFPIDSVTVAPIQLPEKDEEVPDNANVTTIGWGKHWYFGEIQDGLRKVDIHIWQQWLCESVWHDINYNVHPTQICAIRFKNNKHYDACTGDEGGPLLYEGKVVGLVSWGHFCGAMDGKHIAFAPPRTAGSTYFNYKKFHSVVLLAIVDARCRFSLIDIGCNGRVSDGGVYANSLISSALRENWLKVSLQKNATHWCGATILNQDWALTAAHCVEVLHLVLFCKDVTHEDTYEVLAGTNSVTEGGTRHTVTDISSHEGYNASDSWVNDIAVLKVSPAFPIDGVTVAPIQLPEQGEEVPDSATATVVGWGKLWYFGPYPDGLLKVDV
ncbi:trypsin-like [Schistocerca piceifrons]|uniref:trypsin-like n=1 Tax=Schistocerca piceifrons TaxID=274613 RepID=UPI001F5E95E0|nr:trypsin-like [Schistocerca piceifrons]